MPAGEAGGGVVVFGACCGALPSGVSPVLSGSVFFLSLKRVLSPVVVAFFFFLVVVSPARPNGPACVWRSATSAASGAAGVSGSSCGPFGFGSLGSLARSLYRVFFSGFGVLSNGLSGSAFAATCGGKAPASSVWLEGAAGKVFCGAWPKRIFSFLLGFADA